MRNIRAIVQRGFMAPLLVTVFVSLAAFGAEGANTTNGKAAPAQIDTSGPSQLIESAANILLTDVDQHRAQYAKDLTGLYKVVENTLLPNFDTPYAAQLVLGQHWRGATPEQRKRFVDAFYKRLLYNYG